MAKRIMNKFSISEISAVDRPAQAHARSLILKREGHVFKGLYEVSCFANFLDSLAYGVQRAWEERDTEGDASEVPEAMSEWIDRGAQIFLDMAQEEVDELIRGDMRKRAPGLNEDDLDYITIGKRFFSADQRRKDAESGAAMKDGSFPIHNKEDLRNAERLAGHAKDPSAARAHIRSRAKALGLELSDTVKKDEPMTDDDKAAFAAMQKKLADADSALAKANEEIAKLKPVEKVDEAAVLAKMAAENPAIASLMKRAEENDARAKAQEALVKSLAEKDEVASFAKRAVSLGLPEAQGEVLRKAFVGDKEAIAKLEALIKGLNEQVKTGKIFEEFGTTQGGDVTSGDALMKAKVEEIKKSNPKLSDAQAFTRAYTDPANVEIKKAYDAEQAKKLSKVA